MNNYYSQEWPSFLLYTFTYEHEVRIMYDLNYSSLSSLHYHRTSLTIIINIITSENNNLLPTRVSMTRATIRVAVFFFAIIIYIQNAYILQAPTSGLLHDASLAVQANIPHQYRKVMAERRAETVSVCVCVCFLQPPAHVPFSRCCIVLVRLRAACAHTHACLRPTKCHVATVKFVNLRVVDSRRSAHKQKKKTTTTKY